MGEHSAGTGGDESTRTDEREEARSRSRSRRGVLRALGGATALSVTPALVDRGTAEAGVRRAGTMQAGTTQADRTTVVLGARRDYWLGLQPRAIEGQRNPTLRLREGGQYRLAWVNLDGAQHRFRLLDADGNAAARTRPADRQGATRATRFRAGESLAGYECEFHPEEMRGTVSFGEGFPTTQAAETTEAGGNATETTADATEATTAEPTEATTAEETTETTTGGAGNVVEVAVGPEGDYFRFVPERVEIPVGGTVRWQFESAGHNVSARPEAARQVSLPEGADPFSSYPPGESFIVVPQGETYEYQFTVPGEYVYVCLPHVGEGMVGTVVVTE